MNRKLTEMSLKYFLYIFNRFNFCLSVPAHPTAAATVCCLSRLRASRQDHEMGLEYNLSQGNCWGGGQELAENH